MHPEAPAILSTLLLPTPKFYSLEQALESGNAAFYIHRASNSPISSGLATLEELRTHFARYQQDYASRNILTIAHKYSHSLGGVSIAHDSFVYTEFVSGHSIMLLRRGRCGGRIITNRALQSSVTASVFQGFEARQQETYIYTPCGLPSGGLFDKVTDGLNPHLGSLRSGYLYEWFVGDGELVFCDVHPLLAPDFLADAYRCVGESDFIAYQRGQKGNPCRVLLDSFDCDLERAPTEPTLLEVRNGALLSHFITRAQMADITIHVNTLSWHFKK